MYNIRKSIKLVFSTVLFLAIVPSIIFGEILTTKNYIITISNLCPEGCVTCVNVNYVGVSRSSGKKIELTGNTIHTTCADGKTPCRFLGYEFKNGNITYVVLESGLLQVIQDQSKFLIEEKGTWDY